MNMFSRPWTALVLALLLGLTSVQMAVARGSARPAGEMVLCTGTGPVSVQIDAEGNPVGPVHLCPDCVMSLIVALPGSAVLAPLVLVFGDVAHPWIRVVGRRAAPRDAVARGPPDLV